MIVLALAAVFAFSGCVNLGGTAQPKTTTDERSKQIDNQEFTLRIPREWDVIEAKDITSDVPSETVLVVRNNVKNEDFTANVNIVRKNLQTTKDTLEYAKEVINRQQSGLINYKEGKRDLVKVTIGGKQFDTYLVHFESKKDEASQLVEFVQTSAVKGNQAYIITGSYSTKENGSNVSTVEEIVKSFALK